MRKLQICLFLLICILFMFKSLIDIDANLLLFLQMSEREWW